MQDETAPPIRQKTVGQIRNSWISQRFYGQPSLAATLRAGAVQR